MPMGSSRGGVASGGEADSPAESRGGRLAPGVHYHSASMPPSSATAPNHRSPSSVPPRPPSVPPRPSSPPAEGARVVTLPDHVRALEIADGSRDAMLALLRGVGDG